MDVEGDLSFLKPGISELSYVKGVSGDTSLSIQVESADRSLIEISQYIIGKGGKIRAVSVRKPTLEDVFIKLTGRMIR
jgi:ABC-type multidrug transport system ATPase subunit